MTPRQRAKYWNEWRRIADPLKTEGWTAAELTAYRHKITEQALGKPKSSKHLTNADLDKIFAAFSAIHSPDDFNAQMAAQESPTERRSRLIGRCYKAMLTISPDGSEYGNDKARQGYLAAVAKSVNGKHRWPADDETTIRRVMGIVERRAKNLIALSEDPF